MLPQNRVVSGWPKKVLAMGASRLDGGSHAERTRKKWPFIYLQCSSVEQGVANEEASRLELKKAIGVVPRECKTNFALVPLLRKQGREFFYGLEFAYFAHEKFI